ncbi:hypothetical protein SARC_14414 [Sphaeroforma arctica JP610]|uniref:Uncharacterized protein n=1 Tax=Sphaeroforma arctica JP610 TaxID=667725 RepID=A0A0L0F8I2_9EUKA|nr:hypothetical protein SARC_14414 [Sphaeroforma arctica JP610]KNC73025.1 hypothetical protein SARC_14414 [Sphaeroforma arctica JP610]|eukprot:XP_014146927.1 hypothetical protein SARC_14414 [Sphaeroforma arctica JP610]
MEAFVTALESKVLARDAEREERMQAVINLCDQEQAEKDEAHTSEIQCLKTGLVSMNEQVNVKKVHQPGISKSSLVRLVEGS